MYPLLLALHSLTRWLVLLAALWVLFRAWRGLKSQTYGTIDRRAGLLFTAALDLQLLLGVGLETTSPYRLGEAIGPLVRGASSTLAEAWFFTVFHPLTMILAVVLAHVGSAVVRKAPSTQAKNHQALVWYGITTLLLLLAIPWWRPLFP